MNNKYFDWSKDQLIEYINKLEETLSQKEHGFGINLKWAGNLGQWSWYYKENNVIYNDLKAQAIGYDPKDIGRVGFEFYTSKLHPDDYERVMENMRQHLMGKTEAYEVEYRIKHRSGHYLWYYDRGIVTKRDNEGKPLILEGIVFDITESKIIEQKLKFYAEKDTLTDSLNRRMLFLQLEAQVKQYEEDQIPFSLIMLDIDKFKIINDTYGHLVGDEVLIYLTKVLNENKRKSDMVFRYGGDEFFMLLPNTTLKGAIEVGQRLLDAVENSEIPKVKNITVSIGVSSYHDLESVDHFVSRVDEIMYRAKSDSQNKLKFE